MSDRRKGSHIDPDTLKECFGFQRSKDGKVGCLSCNWTEDPKRETDKNLRTLKEIKDANQ
uniref:Uncharacterized protein n=1 Tax=viral metagenome TaxID=1070528 RepID=A0A6H1ZPE2_9ZZZZ